MKHFIFRVSLSVGVLLVAQTLAQDFRSPSSVTLGCNKICNVGQLNPETCSCETDSNPKPLRRIWPALDASDDEGPWDEDEE